MFRFCFLLLFVFGSCTFMNPMTPTFLIQTGVLTFSTSPSAPYNCFNVQVAYHVPASGLSCVASVYNFGSYSFSTSGFDYLTDCQQKDSFNFVVNIATTAAWTSGAFSYLAHSRTDLLIGSILLDGFSTFDPSTPYNVVLSGNVALSDWMVIPATSVSISTAYISGLRCGNNIPNISPEVFLDVNAGVVSVSATVPSTSAIEVVQISYVIFLAPEEDMFVGSLNLGIFNTAQNYEFQVFRAAKSQGVVAFTISFINTRLACVGSNCPTEYTNAANCTLFGGTVIEEMCIICEVGLVMVGGICICPTGYYGIRGECLICYPNSVPSSNFASCDCNSGYTKQANSCIQPFNCPVGSYWNSITSMCVCLNPSQVYGPYGCSCGCNFVLDRDNQCVCDPYWPNNKNCLCVPGYYYMAKQGCIK